MEAWRIIQLKTPSAASYDESVIRLNKDGVRWQLEPDFAPLLERILNDAGRAVKQSPAKRVTFHRLDCGTFYVKRYRNDTVPLRPLKFFFKSSHSRREWDLAREIQRRGVPIVRHLAYGERWGLSGLRESILITEAFDGQSLLEFPGRNSAQTQSALGKFVRDMHDRGVVQFDLAPNILVRGEPFEMRRVDVHHAVIKDSLSTDERLDNLAFTSVLLPLSDAFFTAYGWSDDMMKKTRRRSDDMRRTFLHRRARRCLKRNAEFAPKESGALQWRARLPFLNPAVENILRDPDAFLSGRAEILKPGRATTVGKADGLVLKRYNIRVRKLQNLIKDLFRPSKARRSFLKSYHLELTGVPTARPIATADRRVARVLLRGYLLMEEIRGAAHLGEWRGDTRQAAIRTADLLSKLHNEGFSHRDLKETNILFDGEGRVFLIDLEGLDFLESVPHSRAAADLSRLARAVEGIPRFSNADRLAFLHRYCRLRGIRPRHLKS